MSKASARRQQFLSETHYQKCLEVYSDILYGIDGLEHSLQEAELEPGLHLNFSHGTAFDKLGLILLNYTGGVEIEDLKSQIPEVVLSFERYGEHLWRERGNRNDPVFDFVLTDDYAALMQLLGLCFLLHRRDLLPRIAAMQDGVDGYNGGADALFEEFMIHAVGPELRYESDYMCALKPYEALFYGLTQDDEPRQLKEIDKFLKRWYKDLAGCAWHDSHKPDENDDQGGYFGYWSFEAGAAVILLGIEDDSSLHKYLYYPKDLVAWCRQHAAQYPDGGLATPHRPHSVQGPF